MKNINYITIIATLLFNYGCSENKENDQVVTKNDSEKIILESNQITDVYIKNIIIYPNQFDKNSIYIDTEIINNYGMGLSQVALTNANQILASSEIEFDPKKKKHFQSFLVSENLDFDQEFEISISALNNETDITNNRYSFFSNVKIERPKVAIISGSLNFNSNQIIRSIDADYDHYYPEIKNGEMDITNFWFNRYDIIIFDNFPINPVSDKWLNLFLKKIYAEKSSVIMILKQSQNFENISPFFPIFGMNISTKDELKYVDMIHKFKKNSFKSTLINSENFSMALRNSETNFLNETIDWILSDNEIKYSFFKARSSNNINEPIFFYGYSSSVDDKIKSFFATIEDTENTYQKTQILFNPVRGYYFGQFDIKYPGNYKIKIFDKEAIVDTINVNIM